MQQRRDSRVPIFAAPAFLFSWVILNPEAKEFDALLEGRVITVLGLVGAYALSTVAVWAFFLLRRAEEPEVVVVPPNAF